MNKVIRNLVVFGHPYTASACDNVPHRRSFSAALCKAIVEKLTLNGEEVDLIDLHAEEFDPVMSESDLMMWRKGEPMSPQVEDYQQRMLTAQRIVFIFPIWWELMPAMTKGFLDKVYAKNILYTQEKGSFRMQSKLEPGTEIVVVTTIGTPKLLYRLVFCKPVIKAIQLGLCRKTDIKHFKWLSFAKVDKLAYEQRLDLLAKIDLR